MSLESGVIAARPGLARPVSVEELRTAVAAQQSWRGVLRALGFTTSRTGRVLREVCDELGLDYGHFSPNRLQRHQLEDVVRTSTTWTEVLAALGFAPGSGSARAKIRRCCEEYGIELTGLYQEASSPDLPGLTPRPEQLRHAGPYLVAAVLALAGVPVAFAPEGAAYDLIASFLDLGLKRIQVKTVTSGTHCNLSRKQYCSAGHGGHQRALYSAEDIDYFGCVTVDQVVYLIPIRTVEGLGSISLRRFDAYRVPGLPATSR